jgi:hypothetical protein
MSRSTGTHDLKALVLSWRPVIAIETVEEERLVSLLRVVAAQTERPLFEWSVTKGLTRSRELILDDTGPFRFKDPQVGAPGRTSDAAPVPGSTDPLTMLKQLEDMTAHAIYLLKDFSGHLEHVKVARQFREIAHLFAKRGSTIILVDATISLPREIDAEAIRYDLSLPDSDELIDVINDVLRSVQGADSPLKKNAPPIDILLSEEQRLALLRALQGLTVTQARQVVAEAVLDDRKLTPSDIQTVLKRKVQIIREDGLLEYYPVEDNQSELGGFGKLKAWLTRAQIGFSSEAQALNLKPPRGILLVGVPGCGKSLAARIIARQWLLPLLKLDAGRLYDKYIGESEKNLRKAIAVAESLAPIVLWIDEIEKGIVSAGSGDADAGLSRRLFGTFLTWLQEKRQEVFVVATANDLSAMPPELLRKGRFDEIFFVDLPNAAERFAILEIHLRLRKQDPTRFGLDSLVSASEGYSGAELEQAVVAALYEALHQKQSLNTDLLLDELRRTHPLSVTRREAVEELRRMAQGRFINVQ